LRPGRGTRQGQFSLSRLTASWLCVGRQASCELSIAVSNCSIGTTLLDATTEKPPPHTWATQRFEAGQQLKDVQEMLWQGSIR
jgi:hypothetical protein